MKRMTVIILTIAAIAAPVASADTARRERCPRVRTAIEVERAAVWRLQHELRLPASKVSSVPIRGCAYARWVKELWRGRHRALAKQASWRVLPEPNDWETAVRVVQRVYPGTANWLLSCSSAESSHGRWVRYGGSPYYQGYEHTNAVGGWLQYRWQTFRGHYRHGLETLEDRGFVATVGRPTDVRAWLSPLGQAIAGGWARWSGNDDSHWSASWGNGC